MRINPSGTRYVYVAGLGLHPPKPVAAVVDERGAWHQLGPAAFGQDGLGGPRWFDDDTVRFVGNGGPFDGALLEASAPSWVAQPVAGLPGANFQDAAARVQALGLLNPPDLIIKRGDAHVVQDWRGLAVCAVSASGQWVAGIRYDDGYLHVIRAGEMVAREVAPGASMPHFGSETLVWTSGGDLKGCSTPDQPVTPLLTPGRKGYRPRAVWVPDRRELLVGFIDEHGFILLAEWSSLRDGVPLGYEVARSEGAGFDYDLAPLGGDLVLVRWIDPAGVPDERVIHLASPCVSLVPEPEVDWFELVPDGQVCTHGLLALFGLHPSVGSLRADGSYDIYLPKNTPPEAEWRRVRPNGEVLNIFDRSRTGPTDTGWMIWPLDSCFWASDTFISGQVIGPFVGERVEYPDTDKRRPWRHEIRLYGLKHGGIMVDFDNRFPGMYATQAHPEFRRERTFNATGARVRFEEFVTPPEARGVIPWGDRSRDVLVRQLTTQGDPGAPPSTFVPCPRPDTILDLDPPKEDPVIRYEELRNLEGRLQDTYKNHGGHPERLVPTNVDAEGEVWRRTYFDLRTTQSHEAAMRRIESTIDVIEGRPDRWNTGGGGGGGGTHVVLPLHTAGTTFRLPDGRIYKYRGVTGFTALEDYLAGRAAKLEAFVSWARSVTPEPTVRVFGMWSITGFDPRRYGSVYYDRLHELARWLGKQGCRLHYVAFTDQVAGSPVLMSRSEQDQHLIVSLDALDGEPNVFLEAVNEDFKNGRIAARFPSEWFDGVLATRSSVQDGESPDAAGPVLSFTTDHTPRDGESERKAKNLLESSERTHKPALGGEPPRVGEWRPRQAADYFAVAELMAAGACIHGSPETLQRCNLPNQQEQASVDAIKAIWGGTMSVIPANAQLGAYTRGGPNAPFRCPLFHDDARALRTFAMVQGDRATCVVVRGTDEPRGDNGWRVVGRAGYEGNVVYVER